MKKKIFTFIVVIMVCFSTTAFASLEGPAEKQGRPVNENKFFTGVQYDKL